MSRDWLSNWLDNPIFVKHLRSRLRRQPLASAIVVTLTLCLCIAWGGYELDGFRSGGAFGAFLALQTVILTIMGASQVGTAVGSARASGILDFHRVSPLTPAEMTLGFFFGAPVREYILFALTLPFSLLCVTFGTPDFRGFVQIMILLVATSWMIHGFSLLNGLVFGKQAGSRGVIGLVIALAMFGGNLLPGFGRVANWMESEPRLSFFTLSLPWLVVVLLNELVVTFFLYLASKRKIDSERLHPFSKPQAIAAMTALCVLLVGSLWEFMVYEAMALTILYALVVVGILLTMTATPKRAEYEKGLWRAQRHGLSRIPAWDDLALNRPFLLILCGLVLVTCSVALGRLQETTFGPLEHLRGSYPLAIANGVMIVAYHGLALQYFWLRFGRRASNYFSLFLFVAWILPIIAGTITYLANMGSNEAMAQAVFALSPVAGLGLSAVTEAGMNVSVQQTLIGAAAITPSLLFLFVFNALLQGARRQVQRQAFSSVNKPQTETTSLS
jgi:hypothetical protein